jgi:hypothetical protein
MIKIFLDHHHHHQIQLNTRVFLQFGLRITLSEDIIKAMCAVCTLEFNVITVIRLTLFH